VCPECCNGRRIVEIIPEQDFRRNAVDDLKQKAVVTETDLQRVFFFLGKLVRF